MPTVVLFKTANARLSLSFVHRREHKRDPNRDVLGHVSLIREIDAAEPHRAHLDILQDLSLDNRLQWITAPDHDKPLNFDGLLAAWLAALDTEELNRRFYQDLYKWFNRAVQEATFPTGEARPLHAEEHVIRLITRLLFVWFMKEKGLIADDLFIEARIAKLLKDYDQDAGDSYYRAVLQNLFFATLNTEIDKRGFSKGRNVTHRDFSRYRFKKEMRDPDALLGLFCQTPFINGGLFDCLDSEESTTYGGWRIDCFSDVHYHKLSIPNRLFFDDDGLIPLFNRYKFTVEENTPAEQEVALDPELLGKVFENLLAAYNPETRETAREQTGSYYTPRPVVDYMVDEALVATLIEKARPDDGDGAFWQERLRYLLDYADAFDDANELFEEVEAEDIVQAIAELKVLDPAVGSGAFPMGVLHKLTLALRRIDPDNAHWEKLQKERALAKADAAFDTQDPRERKAELDEISETFEHYRDSDFGRKLYLIQNSIFGVDIQPVACQIAKLRFFISLAIEQEVDATKDNFGIKPLPNLETRFIAADTLVQLKTADQLDLFRRQIETLKKKLAENRERHFHATTRRQKLECKNEDKRLREALARELNAAGLPQDDAKKITQWDPYYQNAKADWFDPEYMFGVADGFDVVIGNPPYVRQENIGRHKSSLLALYADAATARSDLYCYFYARGLQLLRDGGMHVFVCSNSWLDVGYGAKLQEHLLKNAHVQAIYESAVERQFSTADINTIISVLRKTTADDDDATRFVHLLESFEASCRCRSGQRREIVKSRAELLVAGTDGRKFVGDKWGGKYLRAPDIYHHIMDKCADKLVRLGDIAKVRRGVTTGANDFFYLTAEKIAEFGIEPEFCRPVMTTPQESRRIAINPAELPRRLFMCHEDKATLSGTGALAYIEWGEAQGYHQRRSVAPRRRWYDLGERDGVYLGMNKLVDTTARTFLMLDSSFLSDNFQVMSFDGDALLLCAALNATLFQLMLNTEARTNFGAGVLEIQTYETANIAVVNPNLLPSLDAELFASSDWDVLTPSPERRHIDDAVFDALGLTAGEREAVYSGVAELVNNRKQRARTSG